MAEKAAKASERSVEKSVCAKQWLRSSLYLRRNTVISIHAYREEMLNALEVFREKIKYIQISCRRSWNISNAMSSLTEENMSRSWRNKSLEMYSIFIYIILSENKYLKMSVGCIKYEDNRRKQPAKKAGENENILQKSWPENESLAIENEKLWLAKAILNEAYRINGVFMTAA